MEKTSHVLVVDDDITTLHILKNTLKTMCQATLVTSAQKALDFLASNKPDMILLDVEMPQMNGYELIGILKANLATRDIPVIFLTGLEGQDSELKALRLGALDYMQKPIIPELVRARIKLHLELDMYRKNLLFLVDQKTATIRRLQEVVISMLATTTESRDSDTGNHIHRTQSFVGILLQHGRDLNGLDNLDQAKINDIIIASQLHDIGKVGIPDSILLKPGKLTEQEFAIMKTHTLIGYRLLNKAAEELGSESLLDVAKIIAYTHHEKWDGTGYPQGLKGEEIPIVGRIMSIADVYDALINRRPYKEPFSHQAAREIIMAGDGTAFDPQVIRIFDDIHPLFQEIAEHNMDNDLNSLPPEAQTH
ncbi:MAG: response regulator [Desulfarculales bacterium]|jgi:putative two-component system response regulator|nr:response regulator [Desulfarculales bacterium]